jgi:putative FmdB family regulatory protein
MPLYEYECPHCEWIQEDLRSEELKDDVTYCEKCNEIMERVDVYKPNFSLSWGGYHQRRAGMI